MSIKVSVVVPVHNTGKTVMDGLTSFREQTLPRREFEVIWVDDGSTDDTPDLIASEIAAEENFHLVRSENSGWPGRPRNIGMDTARGSYVHFVDDDDRLAPEALERLYARAEETGADIVCGRTAGHGRTVARVLYTKPMTAGNLRRDTVLLSSMTVHKLFRRDFLTAHGIRFPEGRVRLEDHLFMLRAYLLAEKVATVHDYTCYHWMRREDAHHISFGRIEPEEYLGSVRKIIRMVRDHVEPGPLRDKLIAHWYAGKVLAQVQGKKYLSEPAGYREELFAAVRSLVTDCVPPEVDTKLPAKQRVVSALVRHGERGPLETYAALEAGTTHEPRLEGLQWRGGTLVARISTRLVHTGSRGRTTPVLFSRADDRYRWQLPPAVAGLPGVAEAADFTAEMRRATVTGQLKHRDEATELLLPTTQRATDFPAADDAGTRPSLLARLLRRGPREDATADSARSGEQLYGVCFEAEFTIDPATADPGRPLGGVWDAYVRLDCCGWTTARRLGALRASGVDQERMPAFTGRGPSFANPYWTKDHGNLSLSVDGSFDPLNRAVRDLSRITVNPEGEELAVGIPLTIAPLDVHVPVTVRLERDGADPLWLDGEIAPPDGPGLPALTFRVPAHQLDGDRELHLERGDRSGRLGLRLARLPATGRWSVTR
ncbi:glycosyltransferase family 2 protein [Streptomyces sp. NPDC048636]|uniref:glycosyltransferase family 2 protein n=1 Tax=Streptomyces sp. NPDC048636 TaxID=3155762 RepID=UPI00344A17B7